MSRQRHNDLPHARSSCSLIHRSRPTPKTNFLSIRIKNMKSTRAIHYSLAAFLGVLPLPYPC